MNDKLDISIVIATHNRANILSDTLKQMSHIVRNGINVEFVIVDNNSTDNTKDVILSFKEKMQVKYLFESRPGQNYARNRALDDAQLGKIVVFTDDDIEPNINWLDAIVSACKQWPEYEIFGGKIYPIWPANIDLPKWTEMRYIQEMVFAAHKYKDYQTLYEKGDYPFSGNFWVRRKVVEYGNRFNTAIEWQPKNKILATETVFFRNLVQQGHRIVHCPDAAVGHKITADQLTVKNLFKRSYSCGRGIAHIRNFCRAQMLKENPLLWYAVRYAAITKVGFEFAGSLMPLAFERPQKTMQAVQWLGFNMELLNLAHQNK